MSATGISTDIILYNKNPDLDPNFVLYAFPKNFLSGATSAPTATYSKNTEFLDFAIDSENNVYSIRGESGSYKLYLNDNEIYTDFSSEFDSVENLKLYKDESSGIVFYGGQMESDFFIGAYEPNSKASLSETFQISTDEYSCNDFAASFAKTSETTEDNTTVTTYEGFIYLSMTVFDSGEGSDIIFKKIPATYMLRVGTDTVGTDTIEASLESSGDEVSVRFSKAAPVFASTISENAKITDMTVQNGNLYALFREVSIQKEFYNATADPPFKHYSRGVIVKISTKNFTASGTSLIGGTSIGTPVEFTTLSDDETFPSESKHHVYQAKDCLVGPQKFIAIKPKKLVIADDGLLFYKDDEDDDKHFSYKNLNKIVVFNELTLTAESFELNSSLPIYFDEEETEDMDFQWGGSPYDNTPVGHLTNRD